MYAFVVSVRIQKLELKNVKTNSDLKELEDLKAESRRIKLVTTNIILILLYPKKLCYLLQNSVQAYCSLNIKIYCITKKF